MYDKKYPIVCENAYLYSIWSGKLVVREGCVRHTSCLKTTEKDLGYFIIRKNNEKRAQSIKPGVVYNGMVWLTENNLNKAIELLISDKQIKIDDLRSKMDNLLADIELLEFYKRRVE